MHFWPKNPKAIGRQMEAEIKKADEQVEAIKEPVRKKAKRLSARAGTLGEQVMGFVAGTTPEAGVDLNGFRQWAAESADELAIKPAAPPQNGAASPPSEANPNTETIAPSPRV